MKKVVRDKILKESIAPSKGSMREKILGTSSKFDSYSLITSCDSFDIPDGKSTKTLSISM